MKFTCMYYEFHISECVHVNIDSFPALLKKLPEHMIFEDKIRLRLQSLQNILMQLIYACMSIFSGEL